MQTCIDEAKEPSSERGDRHRGQRHQQHHTTAQRNRVPPSPPVQPSQSHIHLKEGPSINQRGYSRDKALMSNEEQQTEQPDAFGGGLTSSDTLASEEEQQSVLSTMKRYGTQLINTSEA